jgi:peroxiredoxin
MSEVSGPQGSLTEELLTLRGRQLDEAPFSEIVAYDLAASAAAEARVAATALSEGDPAPRTAGRGPLVLTWYLTGRNPFCRAALRRVGELLPQRAAARRLSAESGLASDESGPELLVLAAEPPEAAQATARELGLTLPVEHDDGALSDAFGIRYPAPPAFRELLGLDTARLPLPATYVVGCDGRIAFAFTHPDPRFRAEPGEVARAVSSAKAGCAGRA